MDVSIVKQQWTFGTLYYSALKHSLKVNKKRKLGHISFLLIDFSIFFGKCIFGVVV